jgi:hypothetical protein
MKNDTGFLPLAQYSRSPDVTRRDFDSLPDRRPQVLHDLWDILNEFQLAVFERFKYKLMISSERHEENCACALHLFGDSRAYFFGLELGRDFDGPIPTDVIDPLRDAFPNSAALRESGETTALYSKIAEWSHRWGFEADWCRDHALSVLRHWLQDSDFPFTKMSAQVRQRVQMLGWIEAVLYPCC